MKISTVVALFSFTQASVRANVFLSGACAAERTCESAVCIERGATTRRRLMEFDQVVKNPPRSLQQTRPNSCDERVDLDFSTLTPGDYVTTELIADFGVKVQAVLKRGSDFGFVPNRAARVFDSANPLSTSPNDDLDLGSPNELCPGGGPGVGSGGAPDSPYANCDPLGNILIIQESDIDKPDDNKAGGFLLFRFNNPVYIDTVDLFDIDDEGKTYVETSDSDGIKTKFESPVATGDNALVPVLVNMSDVKQLRIFFAGSGALAGIHYYFCSTPQPSPAPTPTPTPSPTPQPSSAPTPAPTPQPSPAPTPEPTPAPTPEPFCLVPGENKEEKGAGVRFKDWGDKDTGKNFYVGRGDVGVGNCRDEQELKFKYDGEVMTWSIVHDGPTNVLTATIEGATSTQTISVGLDSKTGCTVGVDRAEWDNIIFTLANRQTGSGVARSDNIVVNGEPLADFCIAGEAGFQHWSYPMCDTDFTTDVTTITGTLYLCGDKSMFDKGENDRLEILFVKSTGLCT